MDAQGIYRNDLAIIFGRGESVIIGKTDAIDGEAGRDGFPADRSWERTAYAWTTALFAALPVRSSSDISVGARPPRFEADSSCG